MINLNRFFLAKNDLTIQNIVHKYEEIRIFNTNKIAYRLSFKKIIK